MLTRLRREGVELPVLGPSGGTRSTELSVFRCDEVNAVEGVEPSGEDLARISGAEEVERVACPGHSHDELARGEGNRLFVLGGS